MRFSQSVAAVSTLFCALVAGVTQHKKVVVDLDAHGNFDESQFPHQFGSSDYVHFRGNRDIMKHLKIAHPYIDDVEADGMPLEYRSGAEAYRQVFRWASHHRDDEMVIAPDADEAATDKIHVFTLADFDPWDLEFARSMRKQLLHETLELASYLNMPKLLSLLSHQVATQIRGRTTDQMRMYFNAEDDLSPAEKQKLTGDNLWKFIDMPVAA